MQGVVDGERDSGEHAQGDEDHRVSLRRGAVVAGIVTILLAFFFVGWPYESKTTNTPVKSIKRLYETVEVPVQVTWWYFWTITEMQLRKVPRDEVSITNEEQVVTKFSVVRCAMLILLGVAVYFGELWSVRFAWRWWDEDPAQRRSPAA